MAPSSGEGAGLMTFSQSLRLVLLRAVAFLLAAWAFGVWQPSRDGANLERFLVGLVLYSLAIVVCDFAYRTKGGE